MKRSIQIKEGWQVHKLTSNGKLSDSTLLKLTGEDSEYKDWIDAVVPNDIYELLFKAGRISDPHHYGALKKCKWVAEADWVYRCNIEKPQSGTKTFLHFKGIDLIADIYLNGKQIGFSDDLYLPVRIDITDFLLSENVLIVHIYAVSPFLDSMRVPAKLSNIKKEKFLRKSQEWITRHEKLPLSLGIFDDVLLETISGGEILFVDIRYKLKDRYRKAILSTAIEGDVQEKSSSMSTEISVINPSGSVIAKSRAKAVNSKCRWKSSHELIVRQPELWYPRNYGDQPLYTVETKLLLNGEVIDRDIKKIGFREIVMGKPFDFTCNGKKIKTWGANLMPITQLSFRHQSDKMNTLYDLAEHANMTALRAWGPGAPYNDEYFEEADRRGILLFTEFFHTAGHYPETKEFYAKCASEIEHYVKRVKHHPSILHWCGGNEVYMNADWGHIPVPNLVLYETIYRSICRRYDPDRYYHPNSPSGGAYACDVREGDSHPYDYRWKHPGSDYPALLTEQCRIQPPVLRSMKRFFTGAPEKFWQKGFTGQMKHQKDLFLPASWLEFGGNPDELPPIEDFFDTGDTHQGLLYRFGAAYSRYLRDSLERFRRGKPFYEKDGPRKVFGYYLWSLNISWVRFHTNLVDYFQETTPAYYAMKRALSPLLLSFEQGSDINLWLTNDTGKLFSGTVVIKLKGIERGETIHEKKLSVRAGQGESKLIFKVDFPIWFTNCLWAGLYDAKGSLVMSTSDFAFKERKLRFPKAKLKASIKNNVIEIKSDLFARWIELSGNDNGDEFGWLFDDNYFDMVPGETRRIRVLGKHNKGTITITSRSSSDTIKLKMVD
jgi:hypothetical protein